jgi:hypothetical protein
MRARLAVAGLLLGMALWPGSADASGDGGCTASWKLEAPYFGCEGRIVIGPGNDTRVNLLLLLNDRAGLNGLGLKMPATDAVDAYGYYDYGRTFFDWDLLAATFYPSRVPTGGGEADAGDGDELANSRCQSVADGGKEFLAALGRNRLVPAADRTRLTEGRAGLLALCRAMQAESATRVPAALSDLALPRTFASLDSREFGSYLAGSAAFYAGDWRAARLQFAALRAAKDPWVRETALYMDARSELNAASNSPGFVDEYGYFDVAKADKAAALRADAGFANYLKAYPTGRYAASAFGLVRRARWLAGDVAGQGAAYAAVLDAIDPKTARTAELLEEMDQKFIFNPGADKAARNPLLLAMFDLLRMRGDLAADSYQEYDRHGLPLLTAGELASQQQAFAGHEDLYDFLRANQAFYVAHDYRAVLQLLPDDARKAAYNPLAFSRQVLRGMALAELHDRNEAGFWQELLGGAKALYQRPTVELGLALNWERAGQVGKAFAANSPVQDSRIRSILLQYSAGPELLRSVAGAAGKNQLERDTALFTLLLKELSRASYAAAAGDLPKVRANAPTDGWLGWGLLDAQVPVGLFTRGKFADGYPCPALRDTVARLAADPRDVKGRLCLGDFYRLNGFDGFDLEGPNEKGVLGSVTHYPGAPIPRSRFYAEIVADAAASHQDRAYALHRAIQCYAPSGNNSCGGDDVPETQRKAWFQRLKSEFGDTRWARETQYYW